VWALTADSALLPVGDDGAPGVPIAVDPGVAAFAVGGGAAWLLDPGLGTVTRLALDAPERRQVARVGAGPGSLAYGDGSAWLADGSRGRLLRLDGATGAIAGEVAVGGVPRDVAVSPDGVWVSAGVPPSAALATCAGDDAGADVTLVADLPLRRGARSPTEAMARAIEDVLRAHGNRAGRFRVGYRLCDDSTAQAGNWDAAKCLTNARAYAAVTRVVAEVGPYNSGCAEQQVPVAAAAPGGPLAMVSPSTTSPGLTAAPPGGQRGAFTRTVATDAVQARAMARELRRRGARSVFVLDDAGGTYTEGRRRADQFSAAARAAGLALAGRASWPRGGDVAGRVARSRPEAVYVAGALDAGAGEIVAALRGRLGPRVVLAGPDLLLPVASLWRASRGAASGMLLTAAFVASSATDQAAAAAEVALDAIARSDGTRASVAAALATTDLDTPVGRVRFDEHGDRRDAPVGVYAVRRGGGSEALLSTEGARRVR
jgi:branched-chain amino acid transport system substrate-binding protein